MAVLSMQKINICALKKDRKKILETLQRIGTVEVSDITREKEELEKIDTFNMRSIFDKNRTIAQNALDILEKYEPEEKEFLSNICGQNEISTDNYYTFVNESEEIMRVAYEIVNLSKSINDEKAEIIRIKAQIKSLSVWRNLDIPIEFKGTRKTKAFVGTLPQGVTELKAKEMLAEMLKDEDRYVLEVIDVSPEQTCIFVLCHIDAKDCVQSALREKGFAWPAFSTDEIPSKKIEELSKKISKIESTIKEQEKEIKSYKGQRNAMKFMIDYHEMRSQKYEVISKLLYTKNVFFLSGYIPKKYSKRLESVLTSKFDVAIEFVTPDSEDDVPVVLSNNKFSAPVEGVLESYSLPGKGEVDPTSIMAIFYYLLFGMMLSDAAYGFIIIIVCGFVLLKYKTIKSGLKKTLKMFLYCGISTTFWGILFGSYFGDAIDVISTTFFGTHLTIPALWFVPLKEPMRMLAFCFGFGIVHLFTGLFIQFYELVKNKQYKDALYDVVSWYLLVGGIIVYMLSMPMITQMLVLDFILPSLVGKVGIICAIIGACLIVLTSGRESRNPFKRFLKGLYGLYGVTGYLSDILSYSRLLALGLATGVIAQVFNKMGTMAGNSFIGVILFIFVFIIGHTMNIAINLLGAYVHTNRLQFVEFFGKFYKGGGREFSPFFVDTKYYKVMEDINNG